MLNPHLLDAETPGRGATAPRTPGEDAARPSRAERRREGLLPQSEDPLLRRPSGPPLGSGRRRSDAAPPAAERPPSPRPSPPASGPMTLAASPASTVPPRASARPVPPRVGPAVPPRPSGASAWPAATPDVTQRVSGAAPAESAWGAFAAETFAPEPASASAAQSAPPRTPQIAPRAGDRPAAVPPVRPVPGRPAAQAPSVDRPAAERPGTDRPHRERRDDDRFSADPALAGRPTADRPVDDGPADETMLVPGAAARRAVDVPVGGRAAARLERQAAEAAARKSGGKRTAPPTTPSGGRGPGRDDVVGEGPRAPRRAVQGLLGVVVIALVVLGVWSFTSPGASEVAAQTPAPSATASSAPLPPPPLPSLAPVTTEVAAPPAPVKAPITVLNSTNITGLAARVGDAFTAGGWEVIGTDAYPGDDIAATTVFYTEGDAAQEQAATQLVEQFGADVTGPVERFFDVEGVADPGIVVVATGNWTP